jgi:hypothetical protein
VRIAFIGLPPPQGDPAIDFLVVYGLQVGAIKSFESSGCQPKTANSANTGNDEPTFFRRDFIRNSILNFHPESFFDLVERKGAAYYHPLIEEA